MLLLSELNRYVYLPSYPILTLCQTFFFFQDNIPDTMLKKLKKYIDNPKFTPENVEKVSKVHFLPSFSYSRAVLLSVSGIQSLQNP